MVEIKDRSKLIKSLKSRIYSYKNRDKRHGIENTDITVDMCMELIEKSDGICISCNCEMLFENIKSAHIEIQQLKKDVSRLSQLFLEQIYSEKNLDNNLN